MDKKKIIGQEAHTKAIKLNTRDQEEMHKKYSFDGTGRPLKYERRDPPCLTDRWLGSKNTPACITMEPLNKYFYHTTHHEPRMSTHK